MGRTSSSPKWMAIPPRVPRSSSSLPEVTTASMSASPSSTERPMMPLGRGLENAVSSVFLTIPLRVARSTYPPESNARTAQKAAIFSPGWNDTRFTMALPFPWGPTSGTSWTLSQ